MVSFAGVCGPYKARQNEALVITWLGFFMASTSLLASSRLLA